MVDISISEDKIVNSLTIAEVVSVGTDQLTLSVNPPILYRERLLRLLAGKRASYTSDFYKKSCMYYSQLRRQRYIIRHTFESKVGRY